MTSYRIEIRETIIGVLNDYPGPLSPEFVIREARQRYYRKYEVSVRGSTLERCCRWMANELGTIKSVHKGRLIYYVRNPPPLGMNKRHLVRRKRRKRVAIV